MNIVSIIFLDSLVYSSWLFLVSLGLTLIYGVMKVLNIAHGSLYALGAYTLSWLIGKSAILYPDKEYFFFLFIPISAFLVGLLFGYFIEKKILRHVYSRDEVVIVLVTYGIFLILEDTMKVIFGTESYLPYQPRSLLGSVEISGLNYVVYDLILIIISLLSGLILWFLINFTRWGKLLSVIIFDREIAYGMGINVNKYFIITFIIGSILGGLGGAVSAPMISVVPGLGVEVIVLAFAVVVTGGLGSILGTAVGALIIGISRTITIFYAPHLELFIVFLVMALVLTFRPEGLFGAKPERKI